MEMYTRAQVEHPITEAITGIDIIKEQFKIASGEKLQYKQDEIKFTGHSLEARIFVIDWIDTNIDFLYKILENENFINNNYDTSFISKEF